MIFYRYFVNIIYKMHDNSKIGSTAQIATNLRNIWNNIQFQNLAWVDMYDCVFTIRFPPSWSSIYFPKQCRRPMDAPVLAAGAGRRSSRWRDTDGGALASRTGKTTIATTRFLHNEKAFVPWVAATSTWIDLWLCLKNVRNQKWLGSMIDQLVQVQRVPEEK